MRPRVLPAAIAALSLSAVAALAHHGWSWTTGGDIDLTGVIETADLGMPHGVVTVNAEGEIWTVEVGQPWRNERAGLKLGDLAPGVELRAVGEPASGPEAKLLKAERLYLGHREFALYPERN